MGISGLILEQYIFKQGIIDTANNYIEKSLEINKELGNEQKIIVDLVMQANLLLLAHIDEAVKLGERVLESSQTIYNNQLKSDVYKLLYKCYK